MFRASPDWETIQGGEARQKRKREPIVIKGVMLGRKGSIPFRFNKKNSCSTSVALAPFSKNLKENTTDEKQVNPCFALYLSWQQFVG